MMDMLRRGRVLARLLGPMWGRGAFGVAHEAGIGSSGRVVPAFGRSGGTVRRSGTGPVRAFGGGGGGRGLAAVLLCAPLLACFAPEAAATPTVTISSGPAVTEGEAASFTVTAAPAPTSDLTVLLHVDDDADGDFVASGDEGDRQVTIPGGGTGSTAVTVATVADGTDEPTGEVTLTVRADSAYTGTPSSSVTVEDDDATIVSLVRTDSGPIYDKAGLDNKLQYTISLGRPLVAGEVVMVSNIIGPRYRPGTDALTDEDFTFVLKNGELISFPGSVAVFSLDDKSGVVGVRIKNSFSYVELAFVGAGAQTAELELTAVQDSRVEGSEKVEVVLDADGHQNITNVGGGVRAHPTRNRFWTYIKDTDAGPDVRFVRPHDTRTEGEAAQVTLQLSEQLSHPVTIPVEAASGTATAGEDFPAGPWNVTFPAGKTTAKLTVPTTEDGIPEDLLEQFHLRIDPDKLPAAVVPGVPSRMRMSIRIRDDDRPVVSFESAAMRVKEDAGTISVPMKVHPQLAAPRDLTFYLRSQGTATPGEDYGVANAGARAKVDRWIDGFPRPIPYRIPIDSKSKELKLNTHIQVPVPANTSSFNIELEIFDDDVDENTETISLGLVWTPEINPGSTSKTVVTLLDNDGLTQDAEPQDAPPANPYADLIAKMVEWRNDARYKSYKSHTDRWDRALLAFGETVSDSSLTPMTAAEAQAFADRGWTRWVEVAKALQEIESSGQTTTTTPAAEPELSLSAGAAVDEGGSAEFTLAADPAPEADLTVDITVAQTGDYLDAPGAGSRTVTLTAGATSTTLAIATLNDATDEPDGSVSVTLDAGTGYTVAAGQASATVAVRDDDEPVVGIAAGAGVTEGTSASFTVTANPVPAAPLDVTLTVGQSGDYAATGEVGSKTVTIPTSGSVTVEVATVNDATDEPDGSVSVTVVAGTGYTVAVSPDDTASVAVADDDATATADDDDAPPVNPHASLIAKMVEWRNDARYKSYKSHTDRWDRALLAFGQSVADSTLTPMTAAEAQAFADRGWTRWVEVAKALQEIESSGQTTTTAADPEVSLSGGSGVTEGTSASFTVTANPAPSAPLDVSLTVGQSGDFAAAGQTGSRQVTIPASGSVTLEVATVNDATDEPDGSVSAAVVAGTGYTVGSAKTHTVSVADDDVPAIVPELSLSAGTAVDEGGSASFTIHADAAPQADLTVDITVAQTGDYLDAPGAGSRQVTLAAGATSTTLAIATLDDTNDEPDGSVSVTLDAGTGYTVAAGQGSATVAVRDDDAPIPEVSIAGGSGVAEGTPAAFTVTATPAPATPLDVTLTVGQSGDFAVSGQTGSRQVTIPTGGSVTFEVATVDDATDEPDGAVTATLAAGTGYTVASPPHDTASVAVADNDEPVVGIVAGSGVTEGSPASFTVTANPAPHAALTVKLTIAQSGDHAASGQTGTREVVIPTGGSIAFEVATVNDSADEPDGAVTATLAAGTGYAVAASPDDTASVVVADDDAAGVPSFSVDDAEAHENKWWLRYTIRLSPASESKVSVWVHTRESSPVSARDGEDYVGMGWGTRLVFPAGTTERKLSIRLVNDSHDEGPETFEVELLAPQGGAVIADGVGVMTIVNSDPMPAAFLSRFGRTVAEQALDGIANRMAAPRHPGVQGTLAGQALTFGPGSQLDAGGSDAVAANDNGPLALSDVARRFGAPADRFGTNGYGHDAFGFGQGFAQSRTMTGLEALLGSSFTATGETDGLGGSLAFWGRAAQSSFDGREGTFSLDGEATTAMLGADYARDRWLFGLALTQSAGEGGYADRGTGPQTCPEGMDESLCDGAVREGDGTVEASLTAAIPYAALQASERLKLWGAVGHGTGEVTLAPETGGALGSDITWTMAAAGVRSDLLALPTQGSGPALALTSDALWARTSSEKTHELAASDSDVTRFRLGIEGSYAIATEGGGSLTPKVEVGARHDGGDAETGAGVELGGGIAWSDPALGLSLDLSGRTLITHASDDLEDRGFAASLSFDPDPASARGPSFALRQEVGAQATGGLDALFRADPLSERMGSGAARSRWTAEAAWGLPAFGGRFTTSPHVGLGLATGARDYTLGWRFTAAAGANAPDLSFGVKATRREGEGTAPAHAVGVELGARW